MKTMMVFDSVRRPIHFKYFVFLFRRRVLPLKKKNVNEDYPAFNNFHRYFTRENPAMIFLSISSEVSKESLAEDSSNVAIYHSKGISTCS